MLQLVSSNSIIKLHIRIDVWHREMYFQVKKMYYPDTFNPPNISFTGLSRLNTNVWYTMIVKVMYILQHRALLFWI